MRALLAEFAFGAEAGEVVYAQLPPHMPLATVGAERAEAALVVWARGEFAQRVDVQVETLVAVGAVAVAHEEVALRHLTQIVLVEEFASFTLLAERAQPVLADEGVVRRVGSGRGRRG